MFQGIIPLLVIGGIVYAVVRHRSPSGPPGERGGAMSVGQEVRIPRLDEWVSAGLISAEQASALLDFERERVRSAHSFLWLLRHLATSAGFSASLASSCS
jgi:hypothetical protein